MTLGYGHPLYAASFRNNTQAVELEQSGGWILKRKINASGQSDASGCYPLFCCRDWSVIKHDLKKLEGGILTLAVVTDPFGDYIPQDLQKTFNHTATPYKAHFVIDLSQDPETYINRHHQRNIRKAQKSIQVETCEQPEQHAKTWVQLYAQLVHRHDIRGPAAFSPQTLTAQLAVPGIYMFRAMEGQTIIGMMLWYIRGGVAYYHLAAYTERGYELKASFALFDNAIKYFSALGLHWINLGAGAGIRGDAADGLTRFKKGWSTGTRMAYFCGHVFDQDKYSALLQERGIKESDFFPAYRGADTG